MTPDELLSQLKANKLAPAYLFLGPDAWRRDECRKVLIEKALPEEDREQGYTRLDLDEVTLADVFDDACSYSLFASTRLIWVSSAESALPRGDAGEPPAGLVRFLKDPPPGVTLVLQCSRFDFDGEDKAKLERVRKFYAPIKAVVEFPHPGPLEARSLAQRLSKQLGLTIGGEALDLLIEATGSNASRLANELEKLRLLTTNATLQHVQQLVPDARESTIFALVAALGRRDRKGSLEILDTLVRDGEYLPLALGFLATQFRFALAAKEAKLSNAQAIQAHFSKQGVPMWRARAEQIQQTAAAFPPAQMRRAIQWIFQADRGLRDIRPDDRTIMEQFILRLTAKA
ncbi:MAG TPA: DNA polymerase III subunit delta [Bryobacteraceae bacterium]|nr:DNA polymerase III subunit delta [Bryobacteraceae bacterium]